MIIYCKTQAEVDAIVAPKQVWNDLPRKIVVKTGLDLEPPDLEDAKKQELRKLQPALDSGLGTVDGRILRLEKIVGALIQRL